MAKQKYLEALQQVEESCSIALAEATLSMRQSRMTHSFLPTLWYMRLCVDQNPRVWLDGWSIWLESWIWKLITKMFQSARKSGLSRFYLCALGKGDLLLYLLMVPLLCFLDVLVFFIYIFKITKQTQSFAGLFQGMFLLLYLM